MDRYDALTIAGVLVIGAGVWMIYPPAAVILLGAAVFVAGVRGG